MSASRTRPGLLPDAAGLCAGAAVLLAVHHTLGPAPGDPGRAAGAPTRPPLGHLGARTASPQARLQHLKRGRVFTYVRRKLKTNSSLEERKTTDYPADKKLKTVLR